MSMSSSDDSAFVEEGEGLRYEELDPIPMNWKKVAVALAVAICTLLISVAVLRTYLT